MKSSIERARELVPALILTLLSLIQALALEFFWSKTGSSEFLWQWGWNAAIGWLQIMVVLEGILLLLLWFSNPAPWIVIIALLLALGAMFFQYLQARTYWLHSLTAEESDAV